ncbi:MAG TPA: peptide chain release factor N(5)-glutamine methyltransferase [Dehalococcoidia bacterium]|nr:peptide chain release factor N(5)-glutamine methyltransferase [Dehalococcoidia bacterium]
MTLREALRKGRRLLEAIDPDEAAIEAEALLCHVLGVDRAGLYARLPDPLPRQQCRAFFRLVRRRLAREPLAYILGRREFYGLTLEVTSAVAIPRPETELLVEAAISWLAGKAGTVLAADVGTGSGAIALALAAQGPPSLRVVATDLSAAAVEVACRNARRLGLAERVEFVLSDLLSPFRGTFHLVVANLPYVPTSELEAAPPEVRREPRLALDGGPDGLRVIARLLEQVPPLLSPGGLLLLEMAPHQSEALTAMAQAALPGARLEVLRDLSGRQRALAVRT